MMVFHPDLSPLAREEQLASMLAGGVLADQVLACRIERLRQGFDRYLACYRHHLWTPGVVIDNEMRALTELHFPLADIHGALQRLLTVALCYEPLPTSRILFKSISWPDLASRLCPFVVKADPTHLLLRLLADEGLRRRFLFNALVPRGHGNDFVRYPTQQGFLRNWLRDSMCNCRASGRIFCLDAACGDGSGTYSLLQLLLESGVDLTELELHGASIEPLELVSAAYCYFPHAKEREGLLRRMVEPLFKNGATGRLKFYQEDLRAGSIPTAEVSCKVIVCNGLLGGPIMHDTREIAGVVRSLVARLDRGGVLLAANRFHEGWRNRFPESRLAEIFRSSGLKLLDAGEGVAGMLPKI